MSGFEMTRMILTSCQTHSVQVISIFPQSQSVLPCRSCNANPTSSEYCLEVTALMRLLNVSWAVWVSSPPSQGFDETPTIPRVAPATKAWRGPSTLAPALKGGLALCGAKQTDLAVAAKGSLKNME